MLLVPVNWAQSGRPAIENTATINREPPPIQETVVSVVINRQPVAAAVAVLEVRRLGVVVPHDDFKALRLETVKTPIATRGEAEYVPLSRIPGITATVNPRTLELNITAPPKMFAVTRLAMESQASGPMTPAATGAFLNYDVLAYQSRDVRQVGGAVEGVFFSPLGSLVSNQLFNRIDDLPARSTRLDTYWQTDFPDRLQRLRVGDNISSTGSWGRAVRYGGLKFGTDFSLSPNLLTLPLLNLGTTVTVPSTVDLYINNALQRSYSVPPGPFSIDQIPVVTGSGNARMVVRNALGQEQVIEVPFFRVPLQLREGFTDYAIEMGRLRRNFGFVSNDYGNLAGAATVRHGFTSAFTGEVRGEWERDGARVAGLAGVVALGGGHSINPGVAFSSSAAGTGTATILGYAYTGRVTRASARLEHNTVDFRQLGFAATELAVSRRAFMSAGYRVSNTLDAGLAYTDLLARDRDRVQVGSLSLSARLAHAWTVSAVLSRVIATPNSTSLSMAVNWNGDAFNFASAGYQSTASGSDTSRYGFLRYSQRPEISGGYGFDAEVGSDRRARVRGEALTSSGQFVFEAARLAGDTGSAQRASARGSVVAVDGTVRTARVIEDSFLMVKAPEVPGAKVIRSGGREFTLDASGRAVVERVQPYLDTNVQVAARTLPIDAVVGKLENRVRVPSKSGVVLELAIKRTRSASFRLFANGKPAPTGSSVEFAGQRYPVGIDGLVFIQDAGNGGDAIGRVGRQSCTFKVPAPPDEPLPDLGDLSCTLF